MPRPCSEALVREDPASSTVIAERGRQLGDGFSIERVVNEINAAGMIPASLIYWEVTGDDRMVRELAEARPLPPR